MHSAQGKAYSFTHESKQRLKCNIRCDLMEIPKQNSSKSFELTKNIFDVSTFDLYL